MAESEPSKDELEKKLQEDSEKFPKEDDSIKEYNSYDEWIVAKHGGSLKNSLVSELVREHGDECCCCCCCCDKSDGRNTGLVFTARTIVPVGCSSGFRKAVQLRWDGDPSTQVDITVQVDRGMWQSEIQAWGASQPCNLRLFELRNRPSSETAFWRPWTLGHPNPYRATFRAYPVVSGQRQRPVTVTVIIN